MLRCGGECLIHERLLRDLMGASLSEVPVTASDPKRTFTRPQLPLSPYRIDALLRRAFWIDRQSVAGAGPACTCPIEDTRLRLDRRVVVQGTARNNDSVDLL